MTTLRFEEVAPDAAAFLAIVRGRYRPPSIPDVETAARAAAAREMPRDALADALGTRLRELGAPPEALASAERLRTPGVVTVVAGQQPALFGGPHLVVSKALAAVAWARRLEAAGRPCVPVFWVASEDHDHAEADHVSVLDRDGGVRRIRVSLPGDRRMLSCVPVPDEVSSALAALAECLPAGPGREEALAAARPEPGDTMGGAFARILLRLLGRFGLVTVEPETVRPFALDVARAEITRPGEMAAAIRRAEADLVAATGAPAPLALRREGLLYMVEDGVRMPLRRSAEGFSVGERAMTPSALLARVERSPGLVSWNVAARVVAQNAALPVAAQVCGPAELAYCAVLGDAHAVAGVPPSAVVARPGVTWIEARVLARCRELGREPGEVVRAPASLGLASEPSVPPELGEVRRRAAGLPEGRAPATRRRRAAALRHLELYEAALLRESGEAAAAGADRRRRILAALRPGGSLQERELSILPFLARHGAAMLDRVLEVVAQPGAEHEVVPAAGDR